MAEGKDKEKKTAAIGECQDLCSSGIARMGADACAGADARMGAEACAGVDARMGADVHIRTDACAGADARIRADASMGADARIEIDTRVGDVAYAREFAAAVAAQGGRAYFVGGCVRDALLGRQSKDLDIEVHGIDRETLERILGEFGTVTNVGESFGIYKLFGNDIDVALPRTEVCVGKGHRDFEVQVDPTLGIKEAARRRDFTMNALYQDVLTGETIDCYGGADDLRSGVIRHVDSRTFGEDPLRVLRAAQFAARFDMHIDASTMALCGTMPLEHLPHERVAEETKKALLKAKRPSRYFRVLRDMGQLKGWFDEVDALIGVEQNPCFHPEGDVFEHTMCVLDSAAALRERAQWPLGLMLAALCHDMGKPKTTFRLETGRIVSYGHENEGVEVAQAFMDRVFHEKRLKQYVLNMVKLHMRPGSLLNANAKQKSFTKLFDESCCPSDLCLLAQADWEGSTGGEPFSTVEGRLVGHLRSFEELMAKPYVKGNDLIAAGVEPGPEMGEVLAFAHKVRLAGVPKDEALTQCLGVYRALHRKAENKRKHSCP